MVDDESKSRRGKNQELKAEGVMIVVVCCLKLDIHKVEGSKRCCQVHNLQFTIVMLNALNYNIM